MGICNSNNDADTVKVFENDSVIDIDIIDTGIIDIGITSVIDINQVVLIIKPIKSLKSLEIRNIRNVFLTEYKKSIIK